LPSLWTTAYDRRAMAGTDPVTIRSLDAADAPVFHRLRLRALHDHPDAFGRAPEEMEAVEVWTERLGADVGSDGDFVLGAFEGDTLVGVAGCRRERWVKHRHMATIWGMYVAPARRGTGLGRRLLMTAVDRARTWPGLESLWLDVTTTNRGARALYVSCGFLSIAVRPRTLKVGDHRYDEELMMLELQPARRV
jgi:ribosomal protein S18 acetylase RimI-like enzyme